MNIQEWFEQKGSYEVGVALYASQKRHSKSLYRSFVRSKNPRNIAKLKYELRKFLRYATAPTQPAKEEIPPAQPPSQDEKIVRVSTARTFPAVTMAMLPTSMHARYEKQKAAWHKQCRLKLRLNELAPERQEQALLFIKEIMKLRDFVDKVWEEIDYYLENKRQLPTKANDYKELSPMQLVNERQKLWQRKTKRKATLKKWESELKDPKKEAAQVRKINRQRETLRQIDIDIEQLNRLINEG